MTVKSAAASQNQDQNDNEYQHASFLFSHTLHFQDFRQSITLRLAALAIPRMPSRVFAFSASRLQESDWMPFFSGDSSPAVSSLADIEPLNCKVRG
jgi:hypothetical protein